MAVRFAEVDSGNRYDVEKEGDMVLVRQELGDVLRDFRLQKGRTLRQVASKASVALGYLSEVERGQKEASSEILASVADALDTPDLGHHARGGRSPGGASRGIDVPDALPADFTERFGRTGGHRRSAPAAIWSSH